MESTTIKDRLHRRAIVTYCRTGLKLIRHRTDLNTIYYMLHLILCSREIICSLYKKEVKCIIKNTSMNDLKMVSNYPIIKPFSVVVSPLIVWWVIGSISHNRPIEPFLFLPDSVHNYLTKSMVCSILSMDTIPLLLIEMSSS